MRLFFSENAIHACVIYTCLYRYCIYIIYHYVGPVQLPRALYMLLLLLLLYQEQGTCLHLTAYGERKRGNGNDMVCVLACARVNCSLMSSISHGDGNANSACNIMQGRRYYIEEGHACMYVHATLAAHREACGVCINNTAGQYS